MNPQQQYYQLREKQGKELENLFSGTTKLLSSAGLLSVLARQVHKVASAVALEGGDVNNREIHSSVFAILAYIHKGTGRAYEGITNFLLLYKSSFRNFKYNNNYAPSEALSVSMKQIFSLLKSSAKHVIKSAMLVEREKGKITPNASIDAMLQCMNSLEREIKYNNPTNLSERYFFPVKPGHRDSAIKKMITIYDLIAQLSLNMSEVFMDLSERLQGHRQPASAEPLENTLRKRIIAKTRTIYQTTYVFYKRIEDLAESFQYQHLIDKLNHFRYIMVALHDEMDANPPPSLTQEDGRANSVSKRRKIGGRRWSASTTRRRLKKSR